MRKALLILAASGLMAASSPARSDTVHSTAEWEQTYLRAVEQYKDFNQFVLVTGAYAGVVGPASAFTYITAQGLPECNGGPNCAPLSTMGMFSAVAAYSTALMITPLAVAATMTQSKAVRALNPDAPFPWAGATAWTLFTGSLTAQAYTIYAYSKDDHFSEAFTLGAVLLIGSNVAAGAQQRQNSTYWSQRVTTTADKAGSQRSPFSVTTAPLATHEVQGLMLYGTF